MNIEYASELSQYVLIQVQYDQNPLFYALNVAKCSGRYRGEPFFTPRHHYLLLICVQDTSLLSFLRKDTSLLSGLSTDIPVFNTDIPAVFLA